MHNEGSEIIWTMCGVCGFFWGEGEGATLNICKQFLLDLQKVHSCSLVAVVIL